MSDTSAETSVDTRSEFERKYPEFVGIKERLESERSGIAASSAPLRRERDKLVGKIQPVESQIRDLNQQIAAIERPRLSEIDNQLGGLAKLMGGRSLQAPGEGL